MLYLASASPRRAHLITLLGIPDVTIRPSALEETMDPQKNPGENVRMLSLHKARFVALHVDQGIVLGADTTVVMGGDVLEKPRDAADAERMLRLLSGYP